MTDWLNECMTDWMTDSMNDWLTDWMTDWLNEWMTDWMNEWMHERMTEWLNEWMFNDSLIDWMCRLPIRQTDRLTDCYLFLTESLNTCVVSISETDWIRVTSMKVQILLEVLSVSWLTDCDWLWLTEWMTGWMCADYCLTCWFPSQVWWRWETQIVFECARVVVALHQVALSE